MFFMKVRSIQLNNNNRGKYKTKQRELILDYLVDNKDRHVTVDEIIDYTKEYGDTPVGILVRKITGMDQQAANEAFNEFLNEEKLNADQIRFVRLIVDYISVNGMIEDRRVMMDEPFRSVGSIVQIFENDMDIAMKIMTVIDQIKQNAEVTV